MWHDITALGQHTRSDDVGRGMTSPPLDSIHDRTTSSVPCHHRLWAAHPGVACHSRPCTVNTVKRRRVWHVSSPLGSIHGRTTSGVACHHRPWTAHMVGNVGRGMTSPPLDSTHGRTTWGVACHHRLWEAHKVEGRRAWHAIIALGRQTRLNDVKRGMPSSTLDGMYGRTTSSVA